MELFISMVATEKGDPGFRREDRGPRVLQKHLQLNHDNSCKHDCRGIRFAGFLRGVPLGEGVVSNEVRGRGILPPFII